MNILPTNTVETSVEGEDPTVNRFAFLVMINFGAKLFFSGLVLRTIFCCQKRIVTVVRKNHD